MGTFFLFNEAQIPIQAYTTKSIQAGLEEQGRGIQFESNPQGQNFTTSFLQNFEEADTQFFSAQVAVREETIPLKVSVTTFFAGLLAWFGWFMFAIFGGIGMS